MTAEEQACGGSAPLSAAARRERLQELANALGERAATEGDKLIVERGDGVALYISVEPDGRFLLTWWKTATTPTGHPRWAEAAVKLIGPGESIHTSALGGGFLVEVQRRERAVEAAACQVDEAAPVARVRQLADAFPAAVRELPPEPAPDYLLPPEPEEP